MVTFKYVIFIWYLAISQKRCKIGTSVLGPLLYVLYTAEACYVVQCHSMHLHLYADDSQIYTSVAVSDITSAVHRLAACIADVNKWVSASRLRFNPSKTEIMWLGAGHLLQQVDISDIPVLSSTVRIVQSARDLGVTLDSLLSLSAHISALCRVGFYQLRQINGGSCKQRHMIAQGLFSFLTPKISAKFQRSHL